VRRSEDVIRSVKKYLVDDVLPAEWEVRLSNEEAVFERPFCRVGWSTPAGLRSHGAFQLEMRRTLSLVLWPKEAESAEQSRLDAEGLVELMVLAFAMGQHTASYARNRAHPRMIPIWDYEGKSISEPAGARATTDFATVVEEPSVNDIEDPNSDQSRIVVCDLRLRWMRSIAVPSTEDDVDSIAVNPGP
jgi:hypothetical protein